MEPEVVAVADLQADKMADLPRSVKRVRSYEDLMSSVDAVSICLPTHLHYQATLDAIASGKHVLLEKPIARNLAEASELIQAARQRGTKLFVGMTHRFYPEIREAKSLIEDGLIGSVVACRDSDVCRLDLGKLPP